MPRPSSAIAPGRSVARERYAGDGPRRVVAQAEAELLVHEGFVHEGERGLTPLRLITGPRRPGAVGPDAPTGWAPDAGNGEANGFRSSKELVAAR